MIGNRKVAAVLMLRDGSSRIKNKCMKKMLGKPLAQITFDMLKECSLIDEIYVSTSSKKYKKIVSTWNAKIIDRPENLSGDKIILTDVMRNAAQQLNHLKDDDFILQVEPTKPLGEIEYFYKVIKHAHENNLNSCFTVKELKGNLIGDAAVVSQDKPVTEKRYLHFGFVRLRTKKTTLICEGWGEGKKHENLPIIRDWEIDIDWPWQWVVAKTLLKMKLKGELK
jgi:CMP-N-acetylneuraminic acid synthetase